MIDQHFAELQLLNSAVVINREHRNGREHTNGSSAPAEVSSTPRENGHSSAAAATLEKEKVDKDKMERKKKHGDRRFSSDVEQLIKVKHRRRPSDIDSLSPEVRRALQSTFGSKLNEIRSRIRQRAPSPPPRALSPPPPPSPPPLQESSPVPTLTPIPTPPPSPAKPPAPAAAALYAEKRTFVERLGDTEGAYMLIAYFSAIFLSGFILLAAEEDDGDREGQEICGGMGFVESRCERVFGYILPLLVTAIFFTFALIVFVFDVSYSLFNIMVATRDFYTEKEKKHMSALLLKEDNDDLGTGRPRLSAAGLKLVFVIDLGFIIVSSALLWMSKTSTVDPLHTICYQRRQLLWMLGLLVMDVVILFSAIISFREPQVSNVCIQTAAKRVFVVLCVLLACTAAYNYAVPESKEARTCAPRPFKEIQMYEPPDQCGPTMECPVREGPEHLQCQWCSQRKTEARRLDWCEANQQCDWPVAKQIQVYGRKDVCSTGFPQCDWPLVKQIQPYENKHRCTFQEFVQCDWPWVKQIQLYEHEERCQATDFSLQRCDWPWLKQIQPFEAQNRCPLKNPFECEWPLVKQIQLFESEHSFSSEGMCRCSQQGNYSNPREF